MTTPVDNAESRLASRKWHVVGDDRLGKTLQDKRANLFEKARGLLGEDADPIEARMTTDASGVMRWDWRAAYRGELDRVVALLNDGLNPKQVAKELGFSLAKSYRLRKRAIEIGMLS